MQAECHPARDEDAPGVVLRVPATMPCQPVRRAASRSLRDLVAMPEHRARRLSATRSPSRSWRAGPRTVATVMMGEKASPSRRCHSTLKEG
jgi:hypothetical protein